MGKSVHYEVLNYIQTWKVQRERKDIEGGWGVKSGNGGGTARICGGLSDSGSFPSLLLVHSNISRHNVLQEFSYLKQLAFKKKKLQGIEILQNKKAVTFTISLFLENNSLSASVYIQAGLVMV